MKFSIITINYNNYKGLKKTIDSVISQTFTDYEYLIIDGGSTDGSRDLIEQYQDHFAYWCSEPDKGIFNAMNKGIDHAKGDYLLFLNSGDWFYDNLVLNNVYKTGSKADVISGYAIRADNGNIYQKHNENVLMMLITKCSFAHQATFIKRELFDNYRYDENYRIASDWKSWYDFIIFQNHSFEYIDVNVSWMDMTGISSNPEFANSTNAETETILHSLFPKEVILNLNEYGKMYNLPITDNIIFLKSHSQKSYALCRTFVKVVTNLYKIVKGNN